MKKMTLFLRTLVCFSLFSLVACSGDKPAPDAENQPETKEEAQAKPKKDPNIIRAAYESATTYAAATDYYFLTEERLRIKVRVTVAADGSQPKVPSNMLEEGVDGPPGANPNLVGATFILKKDETGKIMEAIYDPEQ